jgi:hypothetical protein
MSFGNKSDVKNHLSTKHSLFSHKLIQENEPARVMEPVREEEHSGDGSPPLKVEKPLVRSS